MLVRHYLYFLCCFLIPLTSLAQAGSGNAIRTNGTNDYGSVPHSAALWADSALTIEAWIKPTTFAANLWQNVIVSKDGWGSGEQGYSLRCGANGILSFNLGVQGSWQEALSPTGTLTLNEWQHVAGTFDGSVIRVYVNGVQVGSRNYSGTIARSTYAMTIGRITYTAGGTRNFIGEIDEVRLWSRAVSPATMRDFMCRSVTSQHPDFSRLMAYYTFNGATTTFTDQSSNGLNGTLNGSTVVTSGAAIGDISAHDYSMPFNLSLAATSGETLSVANVTGTPTAVHLYRVDSTPTPFNLPAGFTDADTNQYWGVFFVDGTSPGGDFTYDYSGGTYLTSGNECSAKAASRRGNDTVNWTPTGSLVDANNDILTFTSGRGEFLIGLNTAPFANIAVNNSAICLGDTAQLSINATTGATYQWTRNGSNIGGATTNMFETTTAGSYSLQVTIGPCTYATDTMLVSVNPLPVVSMSAPDSICILGGLVPLTGTPSGGTFTGPGASGSNINPLLSGIGSHTLTYSYTDSNNCSGTANDTYLVLSNPTVRFPGPYSYCESDSAIALNAATPPGGMYVGPGVSGTTFDPGQAGTGTHTVTYTFTDNNGCFDQDSTTYTVLSGPVVQFPGTFSFCEYDSLFLLAGGTPSGGQYMGAGVSNNAFDPGQAGSGTHAITYSFTDSSGCSAMDTNTFVVNARPATPVITQIGNTFTSSYNTGNQWYCGTAPVAGATDSVFTPTVTGANYYVIVTDANGCISDTSNLILLVGLDQPANPEALNIWPNPLSGRTALTIQSTSGAISQVGLYDLKGRLVYRGGQNHQGNARELSLDLGGLPRGIYTLEVRLAGKTIHRKVVLR